VKFSLKTRDTDGANIISGNFFWNMGDGTEFILNKNEKFEHFYEYEGTYVATVRYYSTYFEGVPPNATSRITINVINSGVVISNVYFDGGVELRNTTGQEIDLSGWILRDNLGNSFTIPSDTYILPSRTVTFNPKQTKLNTINVTLLNPMNKFVSFREKFPSTSPVKSSNTITTSKAPVSTASTTQAINDNETKQEDITLNDLYTANVSKIKQKGPPLWIVIFVVMIVGVSALVYFLYRKDIKEEDSTDDFELLD
jgi:hypothetical protein